ncbi:MAG: solute carrier family 23 protein, partial [Oceanisphaera sp.]|nr:solute carrier family 23 protein [Oceanisphaera sp.]
IMFGTVAVAGIRVLSQANLDRRNMMIVAISVGMGIGVSSVPDVLQALPDMLENILKSPVAMGAITAIVLSLILPEHKVAEESEADAAAGIEADDGKKKLGEVG